VSEICVLRRFQQFFSYIMTVAACCMRSDSARVLNAANTDAPCHRDKTLVHHQVTLFWQWVNQSWVYPLNVESLTWKQPVPLLMSLVWRSHGLKPTIFRLRSECSNHWATAAITKIKKTRQNKRQRQRDHGPNIYLIHVCVQYIYNKNFIQ